MRLLLPLLASASGAAAMMPNFNIGGADNKKLKEMLELREKDPKAWEAKVEQMQQKAREDAEAREREKQERLRQLEEQYRSPPRATGSVPALQPMDFGKRGSIKEGDWVVLFYAPWCDHCKVMQPAWADVAVAAVPYGLGIGQVDCMRYNDLCTQQEISAYPTLVMFGPGGVEHRRMEGGKSFRDALFFVEEATGKQVAAGVLPPATYYGARIRRFATRYVDAAELVVGRTGVLCLAGLFSMTSVMLLALLCSNAIRDISRVAGTRGRRVRPKKE